MERVGARPVIGVVLAPNAERGVLIAGVTPDGAAGQVGLRSGDVLLAVDGKALAGKDADARLAQARSLFAEAKAGTPIALRYARGKANAEVRVTPRVDARVMIFRDGNVMRPDGNVVVRTTANGETVVDADSITFVQVDTRGAGAAPVADVRMVRRACPPGEPCAPPAVIEAFRWNGLNLASVDAKLGRYFGTDTGVLVLSTMPAFDMLEPGDVIQRVDGKAVATPREVMDALRGKAEQSQVPVEFMRDRATRTARLTVPKAPPIPLAPPAPPMPPMPPAPPSAHGMATPPAPPAPGAEARTQQRRVITLVRDGKTTTWEDDGSGPLPPEFAPPLPPPPPPAPPAPPARVD
jgi:S1-C subfamily serine protease